MSRLSGGSVETGSSVGKRDPDLERLLEILQKRLSPYSPKITVDKSGRVVYIEVSRDSLHDLASTLYRLGFDHVKSVTGVDYPGEKRIELLVHVGSYLRVLRKYTLVLKTSLDRDSPRIRSLTDIWPSAEFQEREAWEMFGIYFEGHPDLRRILLPEELEGVWPMRKDFVIKTRRAGEAEAPWK